MVELRNGSASLPISMTVWTMSLELATLCGWQPVGPNDPDGNSSDHALLSWQLLYSTSDGRLIDRDDAARLASALERAIEVGAKLLADWQAGRLSPPLPMRTPSDGFGWFTTTAGIEHLRKLAVFLRRGAIKIE